MALVVVGIGERLYICTTGSSFPKKQLTYTNTFY